MNKMVDLVLCERGMHSGQRFLFQAPAFSWLDNGLEKGDRVLVDTENGESDAYIVSACTVNTGSAQYDVIMQACGVNEPLKRVIGKYKFTKFDYDEDETNE